jgi:hypothetical protein
VVRARSNKEYEVLVQNRFPKTGDLVVLRTNSDQKIVGEVVEVQAQCIAIINTHYVVDWAQGFSLAPCNDLVIDSRAPTLYSWSNINTCNQASEALIQEWNRQHVKNTL